jgi:hypothetical protein
MNATPPTTHSAGTNTLPSLTRQISHITTGALAGAATLPVEALWSQLQRQQTIGQGMPVSRLLPAPAVAKTTVLRAGTRFWVFDMTRWQLNRYAPTLPAPIVGGLSGAAGGFAEVCLESLVLRKTLPAHKTLSSQSAKLFFCFGMYTYLSRVVSPDVSPPRPFVLCWLLGAVAGGFGSGIVSRVEGVRGKELWRGPVPKGAMVIGTVISVFVTSCKGLLDWVGQG